jgi:spermidine/putrescine transport system permease protein
VTSSAADPKRRYWWLAAPLAGWLVWFLFIPLALVLVVSVLTRGPYGGYEWTWTTENYARLADGLYLSVFGRSLAFAVVTTLACLALGYPMAWAMATARPAWRPTLFVLLMVPFLTNFVVRVYAIRILLGVEGPLNGVLLGLGLRSEPLVLTDSGLAVAIGMITNYLPFMVLPLYVVFERFDFTLLEAARDLGARGHDVLRRVLLPLTRGAIASGSLLVFVPALGEFMIPDLLGGARTLLLGNLITEQFLKARDWPFGAALAVLLVVALVASSYAQALLSRGKGGSARAPMGGARGEA